MNDIEQTLSLFLTKHMDPARPVLLALSGGPDSLALLHVLRKIQQKFPIHFGVAHIDHGWREESNKEADLLRKAVEQFGLQFHLKKLDPSQLSGNLEAASRMERLKFYQELITLKGYQAVLLGHHAGDQAETVLKRVLEGAELPSLSGLRPVSVVEGVTLWRPWLEISKETIVAWLNQGAFVPFTDSTNRDQKYLRARMRETILPSLAGTFGKEIGNSLCHLGQEAQELDTYLTTSLGHYLNNVVKGCFGSMLDLSLDCPQQIYALKYVLREFFRAEGVPVTRTILETACEMIQNKKSDRKFIVGNVSIYIDRQKVFFVTAEDQVQPLATPLVLGQTSYGAWNVAVQSVKMAPKLLQIGWKSVWNGNVEAILPEGEYRLGPPRMSTPYPGQSTPISKWWGNEKIPAFLRSQVPVIWKGHCICHEFLTMRGREPAEQSESWLHITLTRK